MTGGAGTSGAGGSGGAQFNPVSVKEMAKLRRGNIVWNYVTTGQYVGDQSKMHGDRKLRCNLCGHLFQGGSSKAARHFTQSKFCKAGGMRVLAELWTGTDYTFVSSTAQRVQRWMAEEGIRDTRAPVGGQRQRMDDAERDDIQDALDEEEGREVPGRGRARPIEADHGRVRPGKAARLRGALLGGRSGCYCAVGLRGIKGTRRQERRGRQGLATSRGRYIDGAARSDDIQDRGHDLLDPCRGAMTGGAGSSGAGGSGGAQFNPLSEKEMAKLRRGNIIWNFVTAGQYVGDQSKMHGDRKLRCNLCGHLFQGGSSKAARHFTQSKFCKARGMRVLAELWNDTDYTFVPSTAQRVQRWMADEGIRDTRAPAGGQRQWMDDAERDDIQDALDEEEGREGGAREGGVADEADEAVREPDLPREEVVMTSRGVGRAGPAPRAPRPELDRARREKRTVGQAVVEVPDTGREKRARQTTIDEMYAREKLAEFTDAWLQWIYVKKLPFNAFRGPEFQRVRQAAERVPRSIQFRFPSYRVTAGAGIPSQRAKVATMVSEVRATFRHSGATIRSDGRKSRSGKPLVNFLVGGANGALLYATIARDGSVRDTADVMYRRWRAIILSFLAKDVIGFCIDSASNYTAAARRFAADPEPDIRRITWLPCSTHVCNLMLSDIGTRVVWVKETIIRAQALVRFIKSHDAAHTLFRNVSPRVQLVEPVETRFASVFLMLMCLKGRRDALESILHGDAWARILWDRAHVSQAQWVQQQIRDGEFWQRVQYAILVMSPVHQLLRRMDRGGMMMSVVYEWSQHLLHLMRRVDVPEDMIESCVREVAIHNLHMLEPAHAAAHLLNPRRRSLTYYHSLQTTAADCCVVEECNRFLLAQTGGDPVGLLYRSVRDQMRAFHSRRGDWGDRDLFDAEAADCRGDSETERCAAWWFEHGRAHPELRTIAIRVMHFWTSASPAERNWAEHERVSTARRCKLGFAKLAQLVEIATNLKLASCARQGGGYVLPWVMGTTRSVRDVFGSRATELRPWLEGGDDVDAAAADDDIDDDWTDDDDTPLSRDPTAERVYFTYGGGRDGMDSFTSVITGDVPSTSQASGSSRAGGGGGGCLHSEVRVNDSGEQQPRGGLRHTGRRWEVRSDSEAEGEAEDEEVPLHDRRFSPSHHPIFAQPEALRHSERLVSAAGRDRTHDGEIRGGERTPSDAGIRPRSPSVLRRQDFDIVGLGGSLGDFSVEGRRRASPEEVRTDADVERGPIETEEEKDARLDQEEEERLRSLPQWEGRFAFLDEQSRQRDLETGGGGSRDVDDLGVPEEAVQGEFDYEGQDAAAGSGSDGGRRGDEETAGVPEGQDVVMGGGSPSVPEGQDVVMGRGDSETAGDEGQGAAVCGRGEGGPGGDGDTAGVGGDDGPHGDDDDDHGPEDDPYRLALVLRDPTVPPLCPDDTAHTFFGVDALAHALTDDPFAHVSRKSGKQRAPGRVYSPPPFTVQSPHWSRSSLSGVRGRESDAGEVRSGRPSDGGRDSAGSMPPPPARTPEVRVDTGDRTVAPEVAHSGGSPPPVRGGVGGGWSTVRRVEDRLWADYDAGRGVFTGRTPVQTQAAEGGSVRPSLQMAGRMLGLSRAETRRSLVLEAPGTSTDRLREEQFTSGDEGSLMRPGTRRQHGLSEVEARLAAGVAVGQAALDAIQRERERGIAAQAEEDEDADTESEPIETVARRHRAHVAAAAAAAHAAYVSGARGTGAGGRGGRRGGPHGRPSSGRGRARSGGR
ncbi:hypothetical protein CBR_g31197 [Chara braunii]|uniref:DUF659 domain-containing protein n=1 Tax=Chara braunii TaxID=69332 RepID=A0A388JXN2_CHABU|nr:hypothetical protein CBR_g31197 [Chara braunii]|eukprot:GBG62560.1 hypothetical protein CBR_g31197 [Chara braunii]